MTKLSYDPPQDLPALFEAGAARALPLFRVPVPRLEKLNLGAGNKDIYGAFPLDLPSWDADTMNIPRPSGSVGTIYAFHVLEHVQDPVELLRECQRVLVSGGVLNIVVPYWRSQGAFHDLDHKHFFTEDTWKNTFDNDYYDKNHYGWGFDIGINLIMGLNDRNIMLVTQLIRK